MNNRERSENDLKPTEQERENINNLGGDPYYPGNVLAYRQIIADARDEELVAVARDVLIAIRCEDCCYRTPEEIDAKLDALAALVNKEEV